MADSDQVFEVGKLRHGRLKDSLPATTKERIEWMMNKELTSSLKRNTKQIDKKVKAGKCQSKEIGGY